MYKKLMARLNGVVICLILPIIMFAQNLDSLETKLENSRGKEKIAVLNEIADYYLFEDLHKSCEYGKMALRLSKENNDSSLMIASYLRIGYALRYQYKYESALDSLYQTVPLLDKINHQMQTDILNLIGLLHQDLGHDTISTQNFISQIESKNDPEYLKRNMRILSKLAEYYEDKENFQKALSYMAKHAVFQNVAGDTTGLVFTLNTISQYYNKLGLIQEAIRYANVALENTQTKGHLDSLRGEIYQNIGLFNMEINKPAKALEAFKNSYQIAKESNNKIILSKRALWLGKAIAKQRNHSNALDYFREAYQLSVETANHNNTAEILLESAKSNMILKKYSDALKNLNDALNYTTKDQFELRSEIYKTFSALYENQGNVSKSLESLKHHIVYEDSLNKKEKQQSLSNLRSQYEVDKKEQRIKTLQMDSRIKALDLEKRKARITSLIIGITALIVVIILVFFLYTNKIRTNRALALQNHQIKEQNEELNIINERLSEAEKSLKKSNTTKDKFFSIIAHDVKNPLNTFRSIIYAVKNSKDQDKNIIQTYLDELDYYAHTTIELLNNLLFWARSQEEDIEPQKIFFDLKEVIDKTIQEQYSSIQKKNIKIKIPGKCIEINSDKNMIEFVVRNLLSNAIKFSHPGGNINIETSVTHPDVSICFIDNGTGMDEQTLGKLRNSEYISHTGTQKEKGAGLGLSMCNYLLNKLNGKMKIDSKKNKGTRIEISLTNAIG